MVGRNDLIVMTIDTLTKSLHFVPMSTMHQVLGIATFYIRKIWDYQTYERNRMQSGIQCFQDDFGQVSKDALGTPLNFSTTCRWDRHDDQRSKLVWEGCVFICVYLTNKNVGIFHGHFPSLRTKTTTKSPLRWCHLSFLMGDCVTHLWVCIERSKGSVERGQKKKMIDRKVVDAHFIDHNYEATND